MKFIITHMKAPWPDGAGVGDVVSFDVVPPWALGKCKPAAEDVAVFVTQQAPKEPSLREQAEAMGIKVDGRWTDKRIAEELAKAQAK